MILISGEQFGGFYAVYILMALPFGGIHALLAIAAIIILLVNHVIPHRRISYLRQVVNLIGVVLMFTSLYYFFINDKQHYNYETFQQTLPMFTLALTAFVATCFLVANFMKARTKAMMIV
jgi:nitrate reductase gamma subunit